jgi:hypothetical protein
MRNALASAQQPYASNSEPVHVDMHANRLSLHCRLPEKVAADRDGLLVAFAHSDVGMLNQVVELWRYPSAAACIRCGLGYICAAGVLFGGSVTLCCWMRSGSDAAIRRHVPLFCDECAACRVLCGMLWLSCSSASSMHAHPSGKCDKIMLRTRSHSTYVVHSGRLVIAVAAAGRVCQREVCRSGATPLLLSHLGCSSSKPACCTQRRSLPGGEGVKASEVGIAMVCNGVLCAQTSNGGMQLGRYEQAAQQRHGHLRGLRT